MRRMATCLASAPPAVGHTTNFGGIAGEYNQGSHLENFRDAICLLVS